MEQETDIVKRGSISEIVKAYEAAIKKVESAYAVLQEAETELKAAFAINPRGGYDPTFGTLPSHFHGSTQNVSDNLEFVKKILKKDAWQVLYDALEIDRIASIKRRDEIQKQLESGNLPDITYENVFEMFETLNQNVNEFAKESVQEVYKWLRPPDDYHEMTRYKTNQKNARYELGKKIIKTMMVSFRFGGGYQVSYYHEKYLIALDKVFHMLDGKNMLGGSYRSVLVDAINTTDRNSCETDYFFCRMYQNGNLHIEMLRPDLVQKFNAIAGGANLKPTN